MKRLSLLAINYSSPPMASARAIQVSRLLCGADADVSLFCGIDAEEAHDETIAPDMDKVLRHVTRVPFNRSLVSKISDYASEKTGSYHGNIPDAQKRWNPRVLDAVLGEWDEAAPDIMMTFGNPMSTHLAGLKIKKDKRIPWVAHFSDPWTDNIYRNDNPVSMRANLKLERQVIENADAVVFTSPETVELVMKKYPREWLAKAHYVPHCYDTTRYGEIAPPSDGRYVIRSIGTFYGKRAPGPIFRAIDEIAKSSPELLDGVIIEFAGSIHGFEDTIKKYPAADKCIKILGRLDYQEGLRLMAGAHCLLAVDAPGEFSVFFPSKLVDYIGSGRYIFALSPMGATHRIVTAAGGCVVDPGDHAAVNDALRRVLTDRPDTIGVRLPGYEKSDVCARMSVLLRGLIGHI